MNVLKTVRLAIATCVLVTASSSLASAEIVYMVSGRTLSVKAHREDGESVVLTLRAGGEIVCPRAMIAEILPDEVAYPEAHGVRQPAPAPRFSGTPWSFPGRPPPYPGEHTREALRDWGVPELESLIATGVVVQAG